MTWLAVDGNLEGNAGGGETEILTTENVCFIFSPARKVHLEVSNDR